MPKIKKRTTTVNPDAVKRAAKKMAKGLVQEQAPGDMGTIIAPGTVRRESPLEQQVGSSKYQQMIHDHNDKNKHILDRLPFTFPKKRVIRSHLNVVVECVECGHQSYGSEYTVTKVCESCGKVASVINPEAQARGEGILEEKENVGMFGTASDLLELREKRRLVSSQEEKSKK